MRKVMFRRWIEAVKEEVNTKWVVYTKTKAGTGCWEPYFTRYGKFHQWASAYDEFESGAGNYTVALVETADGTIQSVLPFNIKFID